MKAVIKRTLKMHVHGGFYVPCPLVQLLTGRSKPMHSERPNSDIQMKDNWHAAVRYMQKVNIPTYDLKSEGIVLASCHVLHHYHSSAKKVGFKICCGAP